MGILHLTPEESKKLLERAKKEYEYRLKNREQEKNDNQKQSDTEGDLCEPVRDVLDEGSKLD